MKRILSFFLSVAMIVSVISVANVDAFAKSDSCGADAVYYFDKSIGQLVISGNGSVEERAFNYYDWFSYSEKIKSVKIEDGITSIENGAFFYCENLTDVEMADTVTSIGKDVFSCTFKLQSIKISKNLKTIGEGAFSFSGIKAFDFPSTVTTIGDRAFNSSSLQSVSIPKGVTTIYSSAFANCQNLKEIKVDKDNKNFCTSNGILFNKSKTKLYLYPAGKTTSSYYVPKTVEKVLRMAFYGAKIRYLEIPSSVKEISSMAFYDCDCLITVVFKEGVQKIGEGAFRSCDILRNVHLPATITELPRCMFEECVGLKNIYIPSSIKTINYGAFQNCYNLKKVSITKNLKTISGNAFHDNYSDSLDIGDGEGDFVAEKPIEISTVYCCTNKSYKKNISFEDGNAGILKAKWVSHTKHTYSYYQEKGTTTANGQKLTRCQCGYFNCRVYSKISSVALSQTSFKYDSNAQKPAVTVKDSRGNKISNDNYDVSYSNNVDVGTATAIIKFKNNYTGTVKVNFEIEE